VETERGAAHSRTQRLGWDDRILDRRCGRKDAGKERVQRAAIIGVIACASVRIRASVVTMAIGLMSVSLVGADPVVTGMRDGDAGSRVGWLKRRRDDTGELGDQKEGDQNPNRVRLCPEPLHDSSGCLRKRERLWAGRPRASIPCATPRRMAYKDKRLCKSIEVRPRMVPVWSAGRAPSHARLSRLKTPAWGART
jgi:hypothetical protein